MNHDFVQKPFKKRILSIRGVLLFIFTVMTLTVVFVGSFTFSFFLSSGLKRADIERELSFHQMKKTVGLTMDGAKILVNTMSATWKAGVFSFHNQNVSKLREEMMYLIYEPLKMNLQHMDLTELTVFIIDGDLKNGALVYYKEDGYISTTQIFPELHPTPTDCLLGMGKVKLDNPLECLPGTWREKTWSDDTTKIVEEITTSNKRPFVKAAEMCPTTRIICDQLLCYVVPVWNENGTKMEGNFGGCIMQRMIKKHLLSARLKNNYIFIVRTHDLSMVSSSGSDNSEIFFVEDGSEETSVLFGHNSTNEIIRNTVNFMQREFSGDLSQLEIEKYHKLVHSNTYVDFMRYVPDELNEDWLIVVVTPLSDYSGEIVVMGCVIALVVIIGTLLSFGLGISILFMIAIPLKRIVRDMRMAEDLKLDTIDRSKFSILNELALLQKSFYFLIDTLGHYKAFLPSYLKHQLKDQEFTNLEWEMSSMKEASSTDSHNQYDKINEEETSDEEGNSSTIVSSFSGHSIESKGSRMRKLPRFSTCIQIKIVSLVGIYWLPSDDSVVASSEFVAKHTKLTEVIEKALKFFKGSLIHFDQNYFLMGINVFSRVLDHSLVASKIVLRILEQCDNDDFSLLVAAATGKVQCGVLGSSTQKNPVVSGGLVDKVASLLEYSRHLESVSMMTFSNYVIEKEMFAKLKTHKGTQSLMEIIPIDMVMFDGIPELLYAVKQVEKARNEEWMYTYEVETKAKSLQSSHRVWELLLDDKVNVAINELDEMNKENQVPIFLELKEKLMTYLRNRAEMESFLDYIHRIALEKGERQKRDQNISVFLRK